MECSLRKGACWRSLLLSASLVAPGAALAADNGFYLGLAASDVSSDYDLGRGSPAATRTTIAASKGIVGFRPLDSFAIEANYVDLGETRSALVRGLRHDALPDRRRRSIRRPSPCRPSVSSRCRSSICSPAWATRAGSPSRSPFSPEEREGSDPTYGAGAQFRVGSFALRFEYERFEFDDDDADLVSRGLHLHVSVISPA